MSREYLERRLAEIRRQHVETPRERSVKSVAAGPRRQEVTAPPPVSHVAAVEPLLTLERWAKAKFGEDGPTRDTLRRWAREDRIYPRPRKIGRTYYIPAHADYVDDCNDTEFLQGRDHESTKTQ